MSERASPLYCPYCGEERLEPHDRDGTWRCHDCARVFTLRFMGIFVGSGATR